MEEKSRWKDVALQIDGKLKYITAYFTDPNNVCNKNATRNKDYVGDKLGIFMGKERPLMILPLKEEDLKTTKWTKGKCFFGMGKFYLVKEIL